MITERKIGSDAEDEQLKRDPWRALMLAFEMPLPKCDENPSAHYWCLAAYAWQAEHDRVKRRAQLVTAILAFALALALFGCALWRFGRHT